MASGPVVASRTSSSSTLLDEPGPLDQCKFLHMSNSLAPIRLPPQPLDKPLRPDQRPVLGDDARVDTEALAAHVDTLRALMADCRPAWGVGGAAFERALGRVETLARDKHLPEHLRGLQLRHAWAAAAAAARTVAREAGVQAHLFGRQEDKASAEAWSHAAAVFVWLKRHHLSAAAQHLVNEFAPKEARNLAAAGVRTGCSGDVLNASSGGSLAWTTGAWTVGGGSKANDMFLVDDDTHSYFAESQQSHLEGALGFDAGGLKAKAVGKRLSLHLGRELLEAETTEDLAKMVLHLRAQRSRFHTAGPRMRRVIDGLGGLKRLAARAVGKGYVTRADAPTYLNETKVAKGLDATAARLACAGFDTARGEANGSLAAWLATAYPGTDETLRVRMAQDGPLPPNWLHAALPVSGAYGSRSQSVRRYAVELESGVGIASPNGSHQAPLAGAAIKGTGSLLQFHLRLPKAPHQLMQAPPGGDMRAALELRGALDALAPERHPELRLYRHARDELGGPPPHPTADDFEPVRWRAQALADGHVAFAAFAHTLAREPDRFQPSALRARLEAERRRAFDEIQEHVWDGAYPGGWDAAREDLPAFIARSHDAMSLALGALATHLGLLRQAGGSDDAACAAAQSAVDRAAALLDSAYLPLHRKALSAHSLVQPESLFQRYDAAVTFSVSGGVHSDLVGLATQDAVVCETGAWQAGFSVDARYQVADKQPDAGRRGEFVQLTFGARAGATLAGPLIAKAMAFALERLFPGTDVQTLQAAWGDALRQVQGTVLDVAEGASVVLKWRRSFGDDDADGFALQYVRGLHTRTSGIDLSVPLPTPAGFVSVGVNASAASEWVAFEAAGPEPGYLMLLQPALERLLDGVAHDDAQALVERFEADPLMKSRYFARPDTLVGALTRAPLNGHCDLQRERLAQAREALAGLRRADERLTWFAGEGRDVFNTFVQAVSSAVAAKRSLAFHTAPAQQGFTLRLAPHRQRA